MLNTFIYLVHPATWINIYYNFYQKLRRQIRECGTQYIYIEGKNPFGREYTAHSRSTSLDAILGQSGRVQPFIKINGSFLCTSMSCLLYSIFSCWLFPRQRQCATSNFHAVQARSYHWKIILAEGAIHIYWLFNAQRLFTIFELF